MTIGPESQYIVSDCELTPLTGYKRNCQVDSASKWAFLVRDLFIFTTNEMLYRRDT